MNNVFHCSLNFFCMISKCVITGIKESEVDLKQDQEAEDLRLQQVRGARGAETRRRTQNCWGREERARQEKSRFWWGSHSWRLHCTRPSPFALNKLKNFWIRGTLLFHSWELYCHYRGWEINSWRILWYYQWQRCFSFKASLVFQSLEECHQGQGLNLEATRLLFSSGLRSVEGMVL